MPRGKKNTTPVAESTVNTLTNSTVVDKTDLKSFLFRIRDICRNKGAQMDENGNVYADLIYDDLLFLKEVWHLADEGILNINKEAIIQGFPIKDIKLDTIASLKNGDQSHVGDAFKRLWLQLQRSNLKDIFDRDFALSGMLKEEKKKVKYLPLLTALLEYVGSVNLQDHEDTDPYEYFTQDLKKTKSKYFGQFYTPESITKVCVEEIQPKFGEIGMDPAGGTGKFMRTAATYIHHHEPEHSEWEAFQNMRTMEIESKIYRQGILGAFIKYKKLPDMNLLRKGNSFEILPSEKEQVDYILANPPYGGTVDEFDEFYYNTDMVQKGKKMVKKTSVKPTIVYPFQFVKKDTCVLFLQLIVNKLKTGGRAAVVFNGTIMNDSHRDVMKWFLDNCDLRKIIVNPSGTFKCTSLETYSFIFWKGTSTQKIDYYEVGTNKKLGEINRTQFENNGYDIRKKFDNDSKEKYIINLKLFKICDLVDTTVTNIQSSKIEDGDYKLVYTSQNDYKKINKFTHDCEAVVFVHGLKGCTGNVHYINNEKFTATNLCIIITKNTKNLLLLKYIYYYLRLNKNLLKNYYKNLNFKIDTIREKDFRELEIFVPSIEVQQEIITTLDRIFAPNTTDLADTLKLTDRAIDLVLKDPTGGLLEQVVDGIRLARDTMVIAERVKTQMVSVMKSIESRGFKIGKLGDYYESPKSVVKYNSSDLANDGDIPFFNGKWNSPVGFHTSASYSNDKPYFVGIKDGGGDHSSDKVGMGKFFKVTGKSAITSQNIILVPKSEDLIYDYVYYYLYSHAKEIRDKAKYSINLGHISLNDIYEFQIIIPPIDFQQSLINRLESLESQITALETLSKQSEDNARFILESHLNIA